MDAAKLVAAEASALEYGTKLNRELLKRTLVSTTATAGLKTHDELLAVPAADWKTRTIGEYETGALDELFTARDYTILLSIMRQLYDATQDDIDAIMGGALPVSAG